ncbi:MAG: ComEA family DNA-binding protein [Anaerolineae bacterium]|nr:ComEA family DNA-binding protein [Anaerolineae bacterium]
MLERFKWVIFIGVILAIGAGIITLISYRPNPVGITIIPPPPTGTPLPTETPTPLQIYVTGAVLHPNTIQVLPRGSRVQDAVQAAGGFSPDADAAQVNPVKLLRDGDQVHVPRIGESVPLPTESAKANPDSPVYINTADLEELMRLPGVGEAIAGEIIAYREAHGPFKSLEDLDAVPGIGPARLAQWEGLISFDQ